MAIARTIPPAAARRRRGTPGPPGAVSERKRAANRANARKSTGPRTAAGKARVARNAVRHGLNRPAVAGPAIAAAIEAFARGLCGLTPSGLGASAAGEAADPALRRLLDLARRIAVAQAELVRVNRARHELLTRAIDDPEYRASRKIGARKRGSRVCGTRGFAPRTDIEVYAEAEIAALPPGPQKFALIFASLSREIAALDRYRDRAMSRRESAVRDFDDERDRVAFAAIDASSSPACYSPYAEPSVVHAGDDIAEPQRSTAPPQRLHPRPAPSAWAILQNKATTTRLRTPAGATRSAVRAFRRPLEDATRRTCGLAGLKTGPPQRAPVPTRAESCYAGLSMAA
jgi:hypothetical protein